MREDNASCHFSHTDRTPCQTAPARSGGWGLSIWMLGSNEQEFAVNEQISGGGQSD